MASREMTPEEVNRAKRQLASQLHLIEKLKDIRALHIGGYNSPVAIEKVSTEFFYAVGDVLEGVALEALELKHIDKAEVLREKEDSP